MNILRSSKTVFIGCMLLAIGWVLLQMWDTEEWDRSPASVTSHTIPNPDLNKANISSLHEFEPVIEVSHRESVASVVGCKDRLWPEAEILSLEEERFANEDVFKRYSLIRVDALPYLVRVVEKLKLDTKTGEEQLLHRVEMVADRILVQLQGAESVDDILDGINDMRVVSYEAINDEGLYMFTMSEVSLEGVPELVGELQATADGVAFAEPDFLVHTTLTPNDPRLYLQWGLENRGQSGGSIGADIDAVLGWQARTSASNIVVAVTDTGVRYTHEDLRNNMWVNSGEIAGDNWDNDGNGVVDDVYGFNGYADNGDPFDLDGHGTHVAGIIGAEGNNGVGVSGVAWNVQLMAAKFLHGGTGTTSDGIQVIDYSVANGAHIINASWGGGGYSTSLYNSIARAHAAGIIFVAAAGNNGRNTDSSPHYPSSYNLPNIVSVASSTRNEVLSSFSNYGATSVDIAAPGSFIYSTYDSSDSSYVSLSGTSMAAPCVAGMLALLMAEFTEENHLELIGRLYSGCESLPAYNGKVATGGRANLQRALDMPAGVAPARVSVGLDDRIVAVGSDLTLSVEAQGTEPLVYTWTLNDQVIADATEPGLTLSEVGPEWGGVYRLTVANEHGSETTEAVIEVLSGLERIGEALDVSQSSWSLTGDALWRIQSVESVEGGSAMKSGQMTHQQSSELNTMVEGPGVVTFQWKVSSETYFDYLHFYIDNTHVYGISGDVDWSRIEYRIPAGRHLLRWVYAKDYSVSSRDDAAYLDDFLYVPDGIEGPNIVSQPNAQVSGMSGDTLALTVEATDTKPLQYQWYRDGLVIEGQTQASIVFEPLTATDAGVYQLWVDNGFSQVASQEIILTVEARASLPMITLQPQDVIGAQGDTVLFAVNASGAEPMYFQWMRDGEPLSGQTNRSLQIQDIDFGDMGSYCVFVTNAFGAAQSISVRLTVNESEQNIQSAVDSSIEQWVSSGHRSWYSQQNVFTHGSSALIAGDILDGESTSVEATVEGPGTLYFSWKVSSEKIYDYLAFYNNGALVNRISGEVDWTEVVVHLDAGPHVLSWVFSKDDAYGSGYDTAWLDRVVFAPGNAGVPYVFEHPEGARVELGTAVELSADAVGQGVLTYQWKKDGVAIAGANELVYDIPSWQDSDAGNYTLEVANFLGRAVSEPAVMTTVGSHGYDDYFSNSQSSGEDWIYIEGLGYMQAHAFPWVYHVEHGWWYMAGPGNGEYWIYDFQLGWMWTNQEVYPYFWDRSANAWIYYGGSDDKERWFMNLVSQGWVNESVSGE